MKNSAWLIVFAFFLIAGDNTIKETWQSNKRTKYEAFLKQKLSLLKAYPNLEHDEISAPDQPDMAALQDDFMTLDPELGYVPRERLLQAYKEIKEQSVKKTYKSTTSLQWTGTSSNIGGRTRALMWDPNDPTVKKVWAGGVTGGLWYRNNITSSQSTWQPVDDFWPSLNISCITYDPNDPMTFYVGTGEAQTALIIYRKSSGVGDGIWKSSDGGVTWSLLESTLGFEYVTDIRVRNENGTSVIYAGVTSGIYEGTIHQSDPSDGLFRSTNGGLTWEQVLPDIPGYEEPYSVADIEIGADGRLYVGTMQNVELKGGATIFYTDDGTPGSWTKFDDYVGIIQSQPTYNIPARVILGCAPSNQNVVYAAIGAGYIDGFIRYTGRYIIKTLNKGETWNQKNLPDPDWAYLAWHALIIRVDPNNSTNIFTGGREMWASTNSGSTWSHISDWTLMYTGGGDKYVHCDIHQIEFKPGSSSVFITSTDGGVFYTSTATNSQPVFIEKNQGYNTLQYYTCDIHPQAGNPRYLGGLQDNGTILYQNAPPSINNVIDKGDGAYCGFDEDEPNMWLTSTYYNRYRVFLNGNQIAYLNYYCGIFINPADYDSKINVLYANAVDFYGGTPNTILRIKGIPYNQVGEYLTLPTSTEVYFSLVKVSPWSPEGTTNLFLGTQSGRIYKVLNAQQSPVVHEITSDDFPTAYVSCITIGQSETHIMVTFSNYGVESVWLTSDGGLTWRNIEGNLPDIPVRWAIFHPDNYNQVLLATELGIWSTTNVNDKDVIWTQEVEGLANVRVDMLKLRKADNIVLAATHGRGFYTAYYPVDPYLPVNEAGEEKLAVYPNPTKGYIKIEIPANLSGIALIKIYDAAGRNIFEEKTNVLKEKQIYEISLSNQPKGNYVINILLDDKKFTAKIVKD